MPKQSTYAQVACSSRAVEALIDLMTNPLMTDALFPSRRPELKRQAQEWAGIKQDPKAELFVFVGRWSKQKGVDIM